MVVGDGGGLLIILPKNASQFAKWKQKCFFAIKSLLNFLATFEPE